MSRFAQLVFVVFGVSVLTFLMIRLVPGDAVAIILGDEANVDPARIALLRHQLGLDHSLPVQYFLWLWQMLHGDFGTSVSTGEPVISEIAGRVGVTVELTALGLLLAVVLAIPAGCLMAAFRSSTADYVVRIGSIIGITVPSFWLATMLLYGTSALLPDAQVVGWVPFFDDPWGNLQRMVLPVIALSLPVLAALARTLRAAMLESLRQDYVRTARAKGLDEWHVIFRHALRNALIPFVTQAGILAGYLFGGSVVIEQVFALPGLGRLMVGAIAERNYPLIQAAILLSTTTFVVINFLVDSLYAVIDPRARQP